MSGCHVPDGLGLGKRMLVIEKQSAKTNEEVAQLAQFVHDFVGSINGRVERLGQKIESLLVKDFRETYKDILNCKQCPQCFGQGKITVEYKPQGEIDGYKVINCPVCDGKGMYHY